MYIVRKGYISRWKSISCVCTFICRQLRAVREICCFTGYIAKLTKKKKNGKRGNKLRKELIKIKLSHYYFSLQCASLETTYILYKDIVLPFKLLFNSESIFTSHYHSVPVQISKYPRKVTCNIMYGGGLTILV